MPLDSRRIALSVAFATVMLVGAGALAEASTARISAAVLDVQHRVGPSGAWVNSTVGASLPAGSRVRTGKRARCEVTFPGGTKVRMGPRSDLVITDPATTRAKVVAGEVFAQVVAGTGGAQIQGATVTAAVRGTDLSLKVVPDESMPDPDSAAAEEWYSADSEAISGMHSLASAAPGFLPAVPGQGWGFGNVFVQAWFGSVDVFGPLGTIPLLPGMGGLFGPGAGPSGFNTFGAFPHSFGTGSFQPFWGGWSSGSGVGVTPGSTSGQGFRNQNSGTQQQFNEFISGPPHGALDVVVQSQGIGSAAARAPSTGHSTALAASALGIAATGQLPEQELLGRRFFGPQYQFDLVGLVHDGGSLGSGWFRASAIMDDFYGEIGLQAVTDFDGRDDLRISDLFVVHRRGDTDIIAGRQRWLKGPVNNSARGSLFGVTHFDGVSVDRTGRQIDATLAWVDEFESWGRPTVKRSGWLARASGEVGGGLLGANLLHSNSDLGWSIDAAFPVAPRQLDLYLEIGESPSGLDLFTAGLYFPQLYREYDLDLFVEYADRQGYDSVWSAIGYWEAAETWTGLGGVRVSQGADPEFMIGVAKRFGSLAP